MINLGRRYSARRLVKSVIFTKLFFPLFTQRAAEKYPQFVIFSSDLIGQGINFYGYWEYEELVALARWLEEHHVGGGAMLDVGANIGNHSVFLARHFDTVHAVEPSPRTFSVLSMNASLASNIQCHQIAASDRNGVVAFRLETVNVGYSRIVDAPLSENTIQVNRWKLDDYFGELKDIRLVKIDVEGHEAQAIKGMEEILRKCSPVVVFEQHFSAFKNGKSEVIEMLKENGYTEFYSVDRIPSTQRGGRIGKLWFFFCSLLIGFRLVVRQRMELEPAFYEMLIARKAVPAQPDCHASCLEPG
ncbi:FkbM family methyltransferase [Variovorax paradoxus]|nr:FkbM family methyltransferase [Variovorax paradoxus]